MLDSISAGALALLGICTACAAMEAVVREERTALAFRSVCALSVATAALRVVLRLLRL